MTKREFLSYDFTKNVEYFPDHSDPEYIGNASNVTNWVDLIKYLSKVEGKPVYCDRSPNPIINDIFSSYRDVNYPLETALWHNYYPDIHFDSQIVEKFLSFLNERESVASWISKIDPGYSAPWHWDVNEIEVDWIKKGHISRYSAIISEPDPCHISIIGNYTIQSKRTNDVYKWKDHRAWHAGANAGMTPKFQFNIIAVS